MGTWKSDIKILYLKPRASLVASDGNESACHSGDPGLILGSRGSPGEGNDCPLQYSCLENPMGRGAWRATDHGIAELYTTEKT